MGTKIHKDDYDLSILYTDSLKKTAKKYGPNSQEVRDELQSIDEVLQGRLSDIKNKKERADLKLNVLLISDYGLNGVNKTTKVVLDEYLNFDHVQYIIQGRIYCSGSLRSEGRGHHGRRGKKA